MPIRSLCFLIGQLLFIPSYFYMTKTLKKEKLRAASFLRFSFGMPAHGIHLYDFVYGADLSASARKISM